jgi:hypothetical protein
MIEKLKNSWTLVKSSARVLREDKELLIFPIISVIGLLVVSALFIVPLLFGSLLDSFFGGESGIFGYIFLFFFYLVQYVVIFFANTALVSAARIRLQGGDPTVSDGFRIAASRLGSILGYALIAATVGLILKAFSDKSKGWGRFVISLIGFAWNVATFLVVPVLAAENVGPIEAIKRSVTLLKKNLGRTDHRQLRPRRCIQPHLCPAFLRWHWPDRGGWFRDRFPVARGFYGFIFCNTLRPDRPGQFSLERHLHRGRL